MKVSLKKIEPSPNPIRKSVDDKAMIDLVWSLMENGQVEPVGLCEKGDKYEIVWGHRRVMAANKIGWNEIDAVIVEKDDTNNIMAAGIENLAKEEMSLKDKADWAYILNTEYGLALREISRRSTVPANTISYWLTWKKVCPNLSLFSTEQRKDDYLMHICYAYSVLGDDYESINKVMERVIASGLHQNCTKPLAEAYQIAEGDLKEQVLKVTIQKGDDAKDILRKAEAAQRADDGFPIVYLELTDEEKQIRRDSPIEVKRMLIDAHKLRKQLILAPMYVRDGLYTPKCKDFMIRKLNEVMNDLKTFKESLEEI